MPAKTPLCWRVWKLVRVSLWIGRDNRKQSRGHVHTVPGPEGSLLGSMACLNQGGQPWSRSCGLVDRNVQHALADVQVVYLRLVDSSRVVSTRRCLLLTAIILQAVYLDDGREAFVR
jgi:hypothetical protein